MLTVLEEPAAGEEFRGQLQSMEVSVRHMIQDPDPVLAAQAKIFASETAIKIVNDALQIFGARGYSRELPMERMARDVRMFTIGGGTAQVLRTLVASKMLGWKLPQTRDGYTPKPSNRHAAE